MSKLHLQPVTGNKRREMLEEGEDQRTFDEPPSDLRFSASVLLVGGLLIVIMGQTLHASLLPEDRRPLYLLMIVGFFAFVMAGRLMTSRQIPAFLSEPASQLASIFDISAGQLALLLLAPCFALLSTLAAGASSSAVNLPVSAGAWLIAVGGALAGGLRRGETIRPALERYDLLLVACLFLFAFMLRAVNLDAIPATVSGDEASAGLAAVRFLNGEADNIFTIGWFSFPSLYFAVQSLGILVLGQTVAGLRILSVIAGALTVVGVYSLARSLYDRSTAILAALFLATFHYHIHFSRIGLNNIWDGLFGVVVLGMLWQGWKSGRRIGFLMAGLALGLSQYFYVTVRVLPLLLLIWAGVALMVDRETFRRRLPDLILTAFVALVVVMPLLAFFLRHPDEFNAPMQRVTILNGWLEATAQQQGTSAWLVIGEQMANTALGFTHLPLRAWYNPGVPLLLAGSAGLFLLGLLWSLTNLSLGHVLLLLPLLSMVILGGLSQDAPASQRFVMVTPVVAILVALPLAQIMRWLQSSWPRYRRVIFLGVAVVAAWTSLNDLRYYFFEAYDGYVLGGLNTEVATATAYYLRQQEPPPDVYFFGLPRMGYYSLSTIPYLAPEVEAEDVQEPLSAPPGWSLEGRTNFLFLPERLGELDLVRTTYPGGIVKRFLNDTGETLFFSYEVSDP